MERIAPYFLVEHVFATAEFYRDVLGFSLAQFFGDPPSFTIVERDGGRILCRQVRPQAARRAAKSVRPGRDIRYPHLAISTSGDIHIWVSNVDGRRGSQIIEGPSDRIHAMRELIVRDCNGYVLAFGQG